jgi:hypothetical protein
MRQLFRLYSGSSSGADKRDGVQRESRLRGRHRGRRVGHGVELDGAERGQPAPRRCDDDDDDDVERGAGQRRVAAQRHEQLDGQSAERAHVVAAADDGGRQVGAFAVVGAARAQCGRARVDAVVGLDVARLVESRCAHLGGLRVDRLDDRHRRALADVASS